MFEWGRHLTQDHDAVLKLAGDTPRTKADVVALLPPDALIARCVDLLTAYQSAVYATEFCAMVERVRAAEAAVVGAGQPLALTEAAVRSLSKLMTYRDEYEVAHLYIDPAFFNKLRAQFEGESGRNYQFNSRLAPPMVARHDERGHLVKQRSGPNTMRIFKVFAKLKDPHGTAFDIFGKIEERRTERALIGEYHVLVDKLAKGLTAQKLAQAVGLARLPGGIRGSSHVKKANLTAACIRWNELIAQWCDLAAAQQAARSTPSVRHHQ